MISISWPCAWTWMAEDNFRRDYRADLHGTGINSSYFCTNKQIMETNVCLCFGWCRTLTSQRQQDEDASVSIIFFFAFSLRLWCLTFSSILMRLCCFCVWPLLPLIYPFIRVYPLFVIISTFIAPHQWSRSALLECFLLNVTCVPMVYPCLPAYLDPACVLIRTSHTLSFISTWSSPFQFSFAFSVSWWTFQLPENITHSPLFFHKNNLDISFDVLFCYFHPVRYLLDWTEHCVTRQRRRKSQYFTSYSIFLNNVRNHQASTNSTFSWRSNQEPQTNKYI